jgi:DNA-binding NarL/FixJ family response regulator
MRLLLCDRHSVLTESLALVLGEAGYDVVALTRTPDEAIAALSELTVDVCVIDVGESPAEVVGRLGEVRSVAQGAAVVLLAGDVDVAGIDPGAAQGFAYKDQHVAEVIDVIERVHRGETVGPRPARRGAPPAASGDLQRLAVHLTAREREVLGRLVRGDDTHGVAHTMGVTWATARSHIQSVLSKLGVHSRVEAAAAAVRHGLVNPETGDWLPR